MIAETRRANEMDIARLQLGYDARDLAQIVRWKPMIEIGRKNLRKDAPLAF